MQDPRSGWPPRCIASARRSRREFEEVARKERKTGLANRAGASRRCGVTPPGRFAVRFGAGEKIPVVARYALLFGLGLVASNGAHPPLRQSAMMALSSGRRSRRSCGRPYPCRLCRHRRSLRRGRRRTFRRGAPPSLCSGTPAGRRRPARFDFPPGTKVGPFVSGKRRGGRPAVDEAADGSCSRGRHGPPAAGARETRLPVHLDGELAALGGRGA